MLGIGNTMVRLMLVLVVALSSILPAQAWAEDSSSLVEANDLSSFPALNDSNQLSDLTQVTLLGRGIRGRNRRHESLFMACISPTEIKCATVRTILFNSKTQTAQWLGNSLNLLSADELKQTLAGEMSEQGAEKIITGNLKKLHRRFLSQYKKSNRFVAPVFFGMGLGIMGGLPLLMQAGLLAAAAITPIGLGLFVAGSTLVLVCQLTHRGFSTSRYSQDLQDRDGWNWSTHTSRVNDEIFTDYREFASRGYP